MERQQVANAAASNDSGDLLSSHQHPISNSGFIQPQAQTIDSSSSNQQLKHEYSGAYQLPTQQTSNDSYTTYQPSSTQAEVAQHSHLGYSTNLPMKVSSQAGSASSPNESQPNTASDWSGARAHQASYNPTSTYNQISPTYTQLGSSDSSRTIWNNQWAAPASSDTHDAPNLHTLHQPQQQSQRTSYTSDAMSRGATQQATSDQSQYEALQTIDYYNHRVE